MRVSLLVFVLCLLSGPGAAVRGEEVGVARALRVEDYFALGDVSDPRISSDAKWVAFVVETRDLEEDKSESRIWRVPAEGGEAVPMTAEGSSSSHPRWSPDGRHLAFLSARDEGETQVWTLSLQGGEAIRRTETIQGVKSFEWSPDSKRMVLVLQDPTPAQLQAKEDDQESDEKTPPPWVVTRRQFKSDYVGYLDSRRTHLHVVELDGGEVTQITSGDFDDSEPAWSPDGNRLAFVSNRTDDPDANYDTDIWVVAADNTDQGGTLVRASENKGPDSSPAWSPDGQRIAHISATDLDALVYATNHLAVSSAAGGNTRVLTEALDRWASSPRFSADGGFVYFLLEDSGESNLARIPPTGGAVERVIAGPRAVSAFDPAGDGSFVALVSEPHLPPEVFQFAGGGLVRLSHVNDDALAKVGLGEVGKVRYSSPDGLEIEGFVVKPPEFDPDIEYPVVLRIHGGPVSQYDFAFHFSSQLLAANGYVVVLPNPRGSSGYGQEFSRAIWQSWGERDSEDVVAGVDWVIEQGYGDPDRLAVMGWSYGGMLTNHVITRTDRFAAAITGASATLYVVNYGHDQYQRWWEYELGLPWEPESRALYEKLSPFNSVERIVTPTLIVGGEKDWNVPIINSEQLYLALRRLGREAELVVYPGEFHGIGKPSYEKDLYERYLAWLDKYVKSGGGGD